MAPPPRMSEVFSRVHGLLHGGYNPGNVTWRAVQKSENDVNVTFQSRIRHDEPNSDKTHCSGFAQVQYLYQPLNTLFVGRWTTSNELDHRICIDNSLMDGLNVTLHSHIGHEEIYARAFAEYKDEVRRLSLNIKSAQEKAPIVSLSAMFSAEPLAYGGEVIYQPDPNQDPLKATLALIYETSSIATAFKVNGTLSGEENNILSDLSAKASLIHRVSSNVKAVVDMTVPDFNKPPKVWIGGEHTVDKDTTIRLRFNTSKEVGAAVSKQLNDHVTLTSCIVLGDRETDGKNLLWTDVTRMGFSFTLKS